ncbi:unnamed protein product [Candidula unifasciata]|uniref:Methyltransferase domain-containing protein n=1 Tax=Candidula unifasciata TaxID=100452 RepID=A0A8S3YUR0_9EUPU|nr:unnamed protein product [Candidula unifasciata]
MQAPVRYTCKTKQDVGNWLICQDEPYTIRPPCLVYSFGINWEFGFDDAMTDLGCEVHLFDPSMKEKDHKRANNSTFHNMGIGSYNTDDTSSTTQLPFIHNTVTLYPQHSYTSSTTQLHFIHNIKVIDVLKMDVETYEWTIIDNMIETDVFKSIRQFDVEYHLFPDYPLAEEYIHIYQVRLSFAAM